MQARRFHQSPASQKKAEGEGASWWVVACYHSQFASTADVDGGPAGSDKGQ
jgi:hypothetical protein